MLVKPLLEELGLDELRPAEYQDGLKEGAYRAIRHNLIRPGQISVDDVSKIILEANIIRSIIKAGRQDSGEKPINELDSLGTTAETEGFITAAMEVLNRKVRGEEV